MDESQQSHEGAVMADRDLPQGVKAKISEIMKEMETVEGYALKEQGPVFLENMEATWYVAYKTDAAVLE
jgi:hypothetical protein